MGSGHSFQKLIGQFVKLSPISSVQFLVEDCSMLNIIFLVISFTELFPGRRGDPNFTFYLHLVISSFNLIFFACGHADARCSLCPQICGVSRG